MLEFALSGFSGSLAVTVTGSALHPTEGASVNEDIMPVLVAYAGTSGLSDLNAVAYVPLTTVEPGSDGAFTATGTIPVTGLITVAQSLYIDWNPGTQGPYGVGIFGVSVVAIVQPYKAQPSTVRSHFTA